MAVEITDKLVSVIDEGVIGFLVSAGGRYKVAITKAFGIEKEIRDIDIAQWLELPTMQVVPCGRGHYGVVDRSLGYLDELGSTPYEDIGVSKVYYGYMFKEQHLVPFNSEAAFERMIKEANGDVIE